ncbi:MAG: hypothetical protein E7075_06505 [Bacteroidales bacterium]|nr:hypothetical protein [Bacteroidales bacterium]
MSGKKSINWSKIGISTWNSVGAKTVKSVFTIASKKLTKELADKAEITAEQTQDITDALADCINYMITQKVNHQHVDNIYLSEMLQSNLIPAIANIASNNPKGREVVQMISSYVSDIMTNDITVTIMEQFADNEILAHLQFTADQIAALNVADELTEEGIVVSNDTTEEDITENTIVETIEETEVTEDISCVKEDMTAEEDEQFVNYVFDNTQLDFSSSQAAAESFEKFITIAGEEAKFTELQETKRTQIRSNADVAIKKVEAMREVLQEYLTKSFDERSAIFAKHFEVVDSALINGDTAMLSAGLNAINELAASSPFKALADFNSVQQMLLTDNETEFDI